MAVIVGAPPAESVYVTEHRPVDSAHSPLEGLKVPVPLVEVKLTVPPGESPPTTAAQLIGESTGVDEGWQLTDVVVEALVTASENTPELPMLFESPL